MPDPAEVYERVIVRNIFVPWTEDLLARAQVTAGERVLDVACGTGVVARTIAPLVGPTGKVVGLDISPNMLAIARSIPVPGDGAIEWHQGDATDLPFPDGSFDLVVCQQGLQFFPDHLAGLREMRRVSSPTGRAVVSVWRSLDETPFMKAIGEVIAAHVAPGALDVAFSLNDPDRLERLAREAGFEQVTVQQADLTLRVGDPQAFVLTMMQASAAVLPAFAGLDPDERQAVIERMGSDLLRATDRFIRDDALVFDSFANVLLARRSPAG